MVRSGKQVAKAAPVHVGGEPFNSLTNAQKAAVIQLAVTEVEWNTRTWDVHPDYSELAATEVRATDVLGFNRVSWNAFADVVREKYAAYSAARSSKSTREVRSTDAGQIKTTKAVFNGAKSMSGDAASRGASKSGDPPTPSLHIFIACATASAITTATATATSTATSTATTTSAAATGTYSLPQPIPTRDGTEEEAGGDG
jgi:hypothetical protein